MNKTAYRFWNKANPVFWVAGVKGRVGDWEYTTDFSKAVPLSPYWQKRFAADCRSVGAEAKFVSA